MFGGPLALDAAEFVRQRRQGKFDHQGDATGGRHVCQQLIQVPLELRGRCRAEQVVAADFQQEQSTFCG